MIITIGLLTRRGNKDTKVGEAGSCVLDLEEVGGRKGSKYKKKYSGHQPTDQSQHWYSTIQDANKL